MERVVILLEIGEKHGILHKMSVEPKNSKVQGKSSSHPLWKRRENWNAKAIIRYTQWKY